MSNILSLFTIFRIRLINRDLINRIQILRVTHYLTLFGMMIDVSSILPSFVLMTLTLTLAAMAIMKILNHILLRILIHLMYVCLLSVALYPEALIYIVRIPLRSRYSYLLQILSYILTIPTITKLHL